MNECFTPLKSGKWKLIPQWGTTKIHLHVNVNYYVISTFGENVVWEFLFTADRSRNKCQYLLKLIC